MFSFIFSQFAFYFSLLVVLFWPGYFLTRALNAKLGFFTKLEETVLAVGFSIFISNFLMLTLGALNISLTRWSILFILGFFSLLCFLSEKIFFRKKPTHSSVDGLVFSKKQILLTCLILGLAIFFRTLYLKDSILPSATDLGHHMYWTNLIIQKGEIPNYQQKNVLTGGATYAISEPQNISDFIIGEHLIFAAVGLISGLSVISYFPALVLFIINIFSLLAIFILTLRLFEKNKEKVTIAIFTLFLLGPLFAITPPQAKFISGGVVGNIIGNLLLPLALYFFLRAVREKNKVLLVLALVSTMNLFYTHHLTAFLFTLSLLLSILLVLLFNFKNALKLIIAWSKMFFSLPVMSSLLLILIFAFTVYTPTYITNQAIKNVVGAPKKIEHTGLTLTQFKDAIGEPRLALAIAGILILSYLLLKKTKIQKTNFAYEKIPFQLFILAGWIGIITIISLFPQLIKIGIPSARVANYGTYPFSIAASFCLVALFFQTNKHEKHQLLIKAPLFFYTLSLTMAYLLTAGFFDNAANLTQTTAPKVINQTFNASQFLASKLSPGDQVESDHIYIKADAWTKVFLMQDYNFPLYRANLERYENGIDRNEKCTLTMLSAPSAPDSQKCFTDLNVNFVMVSSKNDTIQFQKNSAFWQIYANEEINIYLRKK
jgi:hypothetical protein